MTGWLGPGESEYRSWISRWLRIGVVNTVPLYLDDIEVKWVKKNSCISNRSRVGS